MQPEHIVKGYCPRLPGERLPASYINHYVANGGVVVPHFGAYSQELDTIVIKILQKAYGPDRKVVGVHSRELLLNGGNVHCITQQNPAAISDGKPASKQSVHKPAPSGGGFFDNCVASHFANRSEFPKKAAPKQFAPTKGASGGGGVKGFFDSSVGSQNGSKTRVLTKAARNQAAATEGSSGDFFDNFEFANRASAPRSAPKQSAPRRASSGGGFLNKSIGSEFANVGRVQWLLRSQEAGVKLLVLPRGVSMNPSMCRQVFVDERASNSAAAGPSYQGAAMAMVHSEQHDWYDMHFRPRLAQNAVNSMQLWQDSNVADQVRCTCCCSRAQREHSPTW